MTDRMEMERLKHRVAQDVFEDTEYEWTDMLDNTEEPDRKAMKMISVDQENFWYGFFNDMLNETRRADKEEVESLRDLGYSDDEIADQLKHNKRIRDLL